ncbi:MAG: TetR family transcriptional regulator [Calditrichia bacterium]
MENKSTKAQRTRETILNAALELFLKDGYEKTTMRRIAEKSGLTPGAAYYYFPSKEHIIFQYYANSYEEQLDILLPQLELLKSFNKRLTASLHAHIKVAKPYHDVSKALFRIAADPQHTLSPFSEESRELRNRNIQLYIKIIEGSDLRVPKSIAKRLPELLWLHKMGIILYWLYDKSPNQEKTDRLIDKSCAVVTRLLKSARLPLVKQFSTKLIDMVDEFKPYA